MSSSVAESTIQTLLEDLDVLEEVEALLDQKNAWWRFGQNFGMERKELDSLTPECPESPTKLVMACVIGKYPQLTVKSFLEALVKLKRMDVIKGLKNYFNGKP